MSEIFLSYRTDDSYHSAPLIWERMSTHFGERKIFLDTASTRAGDDFEKKVWPALLGAKVMLVVIGPDWLSGGADLPRRRIDDPEDYVRREVRTALQTAGLNIVPIMIKNAKLKKLDLPEDIRALRDKMDLPFHHRYFKTDLAAIVSRVEEWVEPLHRRVGPAPAARSQIVIGRDFERTIIANGPVGTDVNRGERDGDDD